MMITRVEFIDKYFWLIMDEGILGYHEYDTALNMAVDAWNKYREVIHGTNLDGKTQAKTVRHSTEELDIQGRNIST